MSRGAHCRPMTVAEEAQEYLAVVEAFRNEGCEPQWQPEWETPPPPPPVDPSRLGLPSQRRT
jgi:hypothetical protein